MSATHRLKQQKRAIIQRHAKPDNLIAWTQVATTLGPIGLLWWGAAHLASVSYWAALAMILPMSLFTLRVLVLMHECGHGSLFGASWLNRTFGFVFGVVAGMPQYVWSQHHDFHHAHNGNWEKYRGPLTSPSVEEFDAMTPAQRRLYQRTRSIAIAPLGGFVYLLFNPRFTWLKGTMDFAIHLVRRKLAQPDVSLREHAETFQTRYWKCQTEYWHMFWNNLTLIACWILMSQAIGAAVFFSIYVLSVSLAGGVGIMLFTVQHNFEHAYARNSESWDYDAGAMRGTSFLELPGWLNWFTANIGYHHVHHMSAKIPNYRLAKCHEENLELFAEVTRIRMRDIPHALTCLLWDSRAQRIISFAEYGQRQSRSNALVE